MLCGQRKSHHTQTKQWNPSVMISSITDNCIPAIVCSQHTRLVNRNRLYFYRSSHTFPIVDLFATYHTHLVKLNRFCSLGSTQTVHPSELYAIYRTHLHLAARFCCSASSQTVYPSELMSYIAHAFIWLPISFVAPHRERLIELKCMPCIAHATKI